MLALLHTVPAKQEFDTCASPDGKIQTTVPPLELVSDPQATTTNPQTTATATSTDTDLQADSLDTVRTVVVPTVIVSLILVVTVLVVVIIVLCRGRSRKRVQGIVHVSCRRALSVGGGLVSACIDLPNPKRRPLCVCV